MVWYLLRPNAQSLANFSKAVTVSAGNRTTGDHEDYKLEVIDNPVFSPLFAQMAVAEVIQVTSGSSRETTVRMAIEAELTAAGRERTVRWTDAYFNAQGGLLALDLLQPIAALFQSPFGNPHVKRLAVKVSAEQTRQTAEIRRAFFAKAQADRGEHLPLHIVLKPFGKDEITQTVDVEVPATGEAQKSFAITVLAGNDAPPDVAPPDSLADYLDALEKTHRATELVLLSQSPAQGVQYRGKLLKRLPASVAGVLDDDGRRGIADIQQIVVTTDWVLTGHANAHIAIRQE